MSLSDQNGQEVLTPEECISKIKLIDKTCEEIIRIQAALKERHEAAKRQLDLIVSEMTQWGTSLQTIQTDLVNVAREATQKTLEFEKNANATHEFVNGSYKRLDIPETAKG